MTPPQQTATHPTPNSTFAVTHLTADATSAHHTLDSASAHQTHLTAASAHHTHLSASSDPAHRALPSASFTHHTLLGARSASAHRARLSASSVFAAAPRLVALFATLSALAAVALALPPPASAAPPGTELSRGAVWPLTPRPTVVRGFELPAEPWLPGHRGLDLSGSPGQPVLSATAGTITYAGPLAGRGVVVVTNGPLRTTYEPVIATIHVGATVAPGDQLGTLSTAGTHCPPHTCLHWGLRRAATYLNPLTLLNTRPVRLLPLTQPATGPNQRRPTPTNSPDAANPASDPPIPRSSPTTVNPSRDSPTTPAVVNPNHGSPGTGPAGAAVVGVSAALTLAGGLLIRRH